MTLREEALGIVRQLQEAGYEAFWVGGCVRDFLLGREPVDYDIATSATADQIEALFKRTAPVGKQFGVMLVITPNFEFQVATFRSESDYQDGRHPGQVCFGDPVGDAQRRDFTINGLFFDPIRNAMRDWVGGVKDLESKQLRAIGKPQERFEEDHLRLLRAVRFAAQLGFQIEAETFAAVKQNAASIVTVSAERVRDELVKLFMPPHAAAGLDLLRESGLLMWVLPEIAATILCEQSPQYHPEGSVYNHTRLMLSQLPPDAPSELAWAALLHDVAKPASAARDPVDGRIHFYGHERLGAEMGEKILERLRFSRKQITEITTCIRYHMQFKDAPQMGKAALRRLLMRPTYPVEIELHRLDCLGSHQQLDIYEFVKAAAVDFANRPALIPPLLTGDDLHSLGIPSGPLMGKLLREIREKQLQDELNSPEEARAWVEKKWHPI